MLSYKPWRLELVLLLGVRVLAAMILGTGIIQLILAYAGPISESDAQALGQVVSLIVFHGGGLVVIWRFVRSHELKMSVAYGVNSPGLMQSVALGFVTGVIGYGGATALAALSERVMRTVQIEPVTQSIVQTLVTSDSFLLTGFIGAAGITLVPAVEEMLFRGIIYPTIKQWGHPRLAWWGSSALFALFHANALITIPLFFLSLLLTWIYERTDNLLAPIAAHATFNAINLGWLLVQNGNH